MANLGPNFYPKLVQIASEVGMKPEDLIAVMVSESGMNPGAVEQKYKGSGLVGFMPSTLKTLGFKGTWEDFSRLSGEEQLDWLKRLVQGFKMGNGGQPFTSAAQYYTANLWPVALRLPGVKQGNPNTPILEAEPDTVTDPKTGKQWSKKYFEVNTKIDPGYESKAYKANPLFDKDKKGAITYGDMMKQVEKNKQSPIYQKAIADMRDSTGYSPQNGEPTMVASEDKDDFIHQYVSQTPQGDIWDQLGLTSAPGSSTENSGQASNDVYNLLDDYLKQVAATEKSNKKLYKKFLPKNQVLIKVQSDQFVDAVEFARILCTALDEELSADSFIHTNNNNVEVECSIHGPEFTCFEAVKQLSASLCDVFKLATVKIGAVDVKTYCFMDKKSSYQQIDLKTANNQYRKFLLKFI